MLSSRKLQWFAQGLEAEYIAYQIDTAPPTAPSQSNPFRFNALDIFTDIVQDIVLE